VSLPLVVLAGVAYWAQTILKTSLENLNLNMDSSSQVTGPFDSNGPPSESIKSPESTNLEVFSDYLAFMLLCVIFNLMSILFVRVKRLISHQLHRSKVKHSQLSSKDTTRNEFESLEVIYQQDQDHQESFLIKLIKLIKPLIKVVLCYTLAFCFFKITLFCAFTFYKISSNLHPLTAEFRTLEVRGQDAQPPLAFSTPKTPEKVSLAMGRVLASFDVEPAVVAFSQDEKWAYVSSKNPQLIRIYDTSDFKAPKQVARVELGKLARSKVFLELSADGTLLIACNYEDVKIINISNPRFPKLLGSFNNSMHKSSENIISMAISPDNKYLFMADIGFAILDISNPSNITLLYTSVERTSSGTGNLVSLSASRDRKLLYLANGKGALLVYNVTDPYKPTMINQVSFPNSTVTSVFLSKYGNLAYIAGMAGKTLAINTLDISNPLETKILSSFTVETTKNMTPIIQATSPHETKLYIVQQEQELTVVDLISMSKEIHLDALVKSSLFSIRFSPSGQRIGVVYHQQVVFIELFTDYPNTKIFTPSNSSDGSFVMDRRFESWAMSHDGNVLFASFNDYMGLKTSFEIWNITDKNRPNRIVSLDATQFGLSLTAPFLSFKMSPDNKRAYLKWWTRETSKLIILDVSGDLTAPKKLKEYTVPLSLNFEDFAFSKDEKILCIAPHSSSIMLYDLHSPVQNIITLSYRSNLKSNNFDLQFAKNDTVLLIITSNISLYNVSNLSNPLFLGSISLTEGGSPRILSTEVLEEEDCLIIEWYQTSRKLRVYNLSNILAPILISELPLPKRNFDSNRDILQEFYGPFVYCQSQKSGFVGTNGTLLRVDLSDLNNPAISGVVPVTPCPNCGNSRFIISPDGNTALATNQTGMLKSLDLSSGGFELFQGTDLRSLILTVDLQVKSTLYIPQEKFLLGERFSDNVFILKNSGKERYQVTPRAHSKVLKLYSHEVEIVSSEATPQIFTSSLPDFMKFNQDTLLLTVEPKSKKDLGVYTVCAAISYQVKENYLKKIGPENELFLVNEIITTLISLGYMDQEFYLTTNFRTRDVFFLPEKYALYKGEIYDALTAHYIEDCTKIEIVPSLNMSILRPSNKIWIDTTSTEALKVDITLLPNKNSQSAQFVSKAYGSLLPEIRDQKTRIVLEGSLNEIHAALQNVVINAGNMGSYDGIISITDGLNYPIERQSINNISDYFLKNSPPFENPNASKTFQEQLERVSVATGQYFAIMWDENTFKDNCIEALHYEVVIDNDAHPGKPKAFPDWLTFSNLALRGTPPEKLSDREVSLKFIAKNEFQNVTIPFKLQIGISPTFALSLLIRYSPMLLTALGFYIKANRIYNIVAKKRYKHPKEYQVQVGEEVSSQTVFPILFIETELKESQTIMKHLLKYLKKRSDSELVPYFVDEGTRTLDKAKLLECINETLSNLPSGEKKKLPIYLEGSDFNRKKITQIIFNQIIMLQLNSLQEKPTKRIFDNIKDQWADLIKWDPESLFIIKEEKLSELLDKTSLKIKKEGPSLLEKYRQQVNQDLLQDVIISHAFSHQSLDTRSTKVLIEVYERVTDSQGLKTFLKLDLEGTHLNSKAAVDYGVNCQLEEGMLVFSGTPKPNFKGKTLAIQIQNVQWRILKEIWIQEMSAGAGSENTTIELSTRSESSLRGKAYEIY